MSEKYRPSEVPQPLYIQIEGSDPPPVEEDIPVLADIGINAVAAAMMSGLNEMVKEGGRSFEAYRDGKISEKQFTYRLVHKGSNAAVKNGVRTGSALVLSEASKKTLTKLFGKAVVKRLSRYNVMTAVCFGLVDQGRHTIELAQGKMDGRIYKIKSVENAGGTGGAIGGAAAGVAIGSVVPGLGTAAGGMIGYTMGMLGAMSGGALGRSLGEKWFPGDDDDPDAPAGPANRIDIPIGE
jgi:hypothetical protein